MLNCIYGAFVPPRLFKAHGVVACRDRVLKCGTRELTLVVEYVPPKITLEQHVRFGIYCAWYVCKNRPWRVWARNWLNGKDRTINVACDAAQAAQAACEAACDATYAAAQAARDAAYAAADAAADAAVDAAAYAAVNASRGMPEFPIEALARAACRVKLNTPLKVR